MVFLLNNFDHDTLLLIVPQLLPKPQRRASIPLCIVYTNLHDLASVCLSHLTTCYSLLLHDDIVILRYLWFSGHVKYYCSFQTFSMMFPSPAVSSKFIKLPLKCYLIFKPFCFSPGVLLHFVQTYWLS